MNYSYRNYTAIYGRSHVSATIRNDDAAIVSMEIHYINELDISVGC